MKNSILKEKYERLLPVNRSPAHDAQTLQEVVDTLLTLLNESNQKIIRLDYRINELEKQLLKDNKG